MGIVRKMLISLVGDLFEKAEKNLRLLSNRQKSQITSGSEMREAKLTDIVGR